MTGATDQIVRIEPADSLPIDDGVLLLYERQALRLNAVAAAVFSYCRVPRTLVELAEELRQIAGEPPDGDLADATAAVVADLRAAGVLRP